jgi:hypothetical protein
MDLMAVAAVVDLRLVVAVDIQFIAQLAQPVVVAVAVVLVIT